MKAADQKRRQKIVAQLSRQQKGHFVRKVGIYIAELGKVPTFSEALRDRNRPDKFPKDILQRGGWGTWKVLLNQVKSAHPDLWAMIEEVKPKVEIKTEVKKEIDPLETLRAGSIEK